MDAQEVMHMTDYSKITALYSRLSVGDEDRDGGESNSIQNQLHIQRPNCGCPRTSLQSKCRLQWVLDARDYLPIQ